MDLIADVSDPQEASEKLLHHALSNFSTDNTSVMVVRFACSADSTSKTQVGQAQAAAENKAGSVKEDDEIDDRR